LQVAFILMVASEMLAAYRGLGFITMQAQLTFDSEGVWAGIILLAILGFDAKDPPSLSGRRARRGEGVSYACCLSFWKSASSSAIPDEKKRKARSAISLAPRSAVSHPRSCRNILQIRVSIIRSSG
ncbi:hypothetical protein AAAK29_02955, partial [Mesorhizobium sp. CCNWLW179-1]